MELKVIILLKILRKDLDYILQILHLTYKIAKFMKII